jgi:hypothetical protein
LHSDYRWRISLETHRSHCTPNFSIKSISGIIYHIIYGCFSGFKISQLNQRVCVRSLIKSSLKSLRSLLQSKRLVILMKKSSKEYHFTSVYVSLCFTLFHVRKPVNKMMMMMMMNRSKVRSNYSKVA